MEQKGERGMRMKAFLLLHFSFFVYSFCGFFSKNASKYPPLSVPFILFYFGMIAVLGIYALLWQQGIKRLPVTFAYANKGITVIWGILLGRVFFGEHISWIQAAACLIIIAGTVLYVIQDRREEK